MEQSPKSWHTAAVAGAGLRNVRPPDYTAGLSTGELNSLIARIDAIPLFAHAYSHHLNFRLGQMPPMDLLRFASEHEMAGVKIHVEDGESRSLLHMHRAKRGRFGNAAAKRGLKLHVETSSTTRADLEAVIEIAIDAGAESVRVYPRYEGRVSQIINQTIEDLRILPGLDPSSRLLFTLEQHEDLKSGELVEIVRRVANPRLKLLFDFGNMINAYETPGEALKIMAPFVTEVHIKDVRIIGDRGGWAHRACRSGEGDADFHLLLRDLLLLGDDAPQVTAFALEEENDMYAPAYRFPYEGADPFIPARKASLTDLMSGEDLDGRLARERREAVNQVHYVRGVLADLRARAVAAIAQEQRAS